MEYKEAMAKALTVKWKTTPCTTGEECWCRIIEPVEKMEDKDGNEIYIIGSGGISKDHAEHIVRIHNAIIDTIRDGKIV